MSNSWILKYWTPIFISALIMFTVYVLLDTFVISRTYQVVKVETSINPGIDREAEFEDEGSNVANAPIIHEELDPGDVPELAPWFTPHVEITDRSYSDMQIAVDISEIRMHETTVYLAEIRLASPEYLNTWLAGNVYGKNIKAPTSQQAEESGAILAINGDFYGARNAGYVVRNGSLYRGEISAPDQQDLVIYDDGRLAVVQENEVSAETLIENFAVHVLSFGPGLVVDGNITVTDETEVAKSMTSNPRTAIGSIGPLHYVFLVSDGRTEVSQGLTLLQLASLMQDMGVQTGYNLDGGGSSTMVFMGKLVNKPTTTGRRIQERSVSDIVYVGY